MFCDDGETVIIGGLRKKAVQDNEERIPFLGEIPGLGKLFGSTALTDANTEMFFTLLRIGSNHNKVKYSSFFSPSGRGVFEYIFHNSGHGSFPAMDFAYNFLMMQENIQFHAAPSVMTVNQTPATINIVEEISINNGAAPIDANNGVAFEQSYTRAQYGITINMTPSIS